MVFQGNGVLDVHRVFFVSIYGIAVRELVFLDYIGHSQERGGERGCMSSSREQLGNKCSEWVLRIYSGSK